MTPGTVTTATYCPACSRALPLHATYCELCGDYLDRLDRAPASVPAGERGAREPASVPDTRSEAEPADPVLIVFPWDVLVSTNERIGGMTGWTTREWRECRDAMMAQVAEHMQERKGLSGRLRVAMAFHPPDNRRRDYHNLQKAILDALQGPEGFPGVYEDDADVWEWSGHVMGLSDDPRCEVHVWTSEADAARWMRDPSP